MSSTDCAVVFAVCTNVADCAHASTARRIEWYSGPGEYCPECGEALKRVPPEAVASAPAYQALAAPASPPRARPAPPDRSSKRWVWIAAAIFIAGAVVVFAMRRSVAIDRGRSDTISVCAVSSAAELTADLLAGYAAKNAVPASGFRLTDPNATACDLRFSTTAETPETVIARDGLVAVVNPLNPIARISEGQLRGIFSGAIRDWSQLGGAPGSIVALLPGADSDENRALTSSLFFGVPIDSRVRRGGTSADVTRVVTGADRTGRAAIGLVSFSQAVSAKVLPLTYLPAPSVLSIASRRYPFTLSIALHSASRRAAATAAGLLAFAHSTQGVAIVQKNGLVSPEGR
jgi:hypothetical protein